MNIKELEADLFTKTVDTSVIKNGENISHKEMKVYVELGEVQQQFVFIDANNEIEKILIFYSENGYSFIKEIVLKEKEDVIKLSNPQGKLPPSHPRPSEDELKEFRKYIATHTWKASKTMNNFCPHEYIINYPCWKKKEDGRCSGFCTSCKKEREAFEHWALFIRKYGERQKMLKTVYTVFCIDDRQYWTMGDPMNTTWVLNRGLIDDPNRVPKIYWLDRI